MERDGHICELCQQYFDLSIKVSNLTFESVKLPKQRRIACISCALPDSPSCEMRTA
jgi:hypothetical protein